MSANAIEWLAVFLFLLLFVGVIIAEVLWLVRKSGASMGSAIGFVLTTDLLGFGIGSFIVSVIFFIMFMMVMGPSGQGGNAPEFAYWITSAIAIIFPPIILILLKRISLAIFKMRSGKAAWVYSVVSSILIIAVLFVLPTAALLAFWYLPIWK